MSTCPPDNVRCQTCQDAVQRGHFGCYVQKLFRRQECSDHGHLCHLWAKAWAARAGQLETLKRLHEFTRDPTNWSGETENAARGDHVDCMRFLRTHGYNLRSHTLKLCTTSGPRCLEYLLQRGDHHNTETFLVGRHTSPVAIYLWHKYDPGRLNDEATDLMRTMYRLHHGKLSHSLVRCIMEFM